MVGPGNRHCANCIGTLSFRIRSVIRSRASERRRRLPKIAERKRKRSAAGDADSTALSMTSSSSASKPRDVSARSKHHYRHYYEKKVKHLLKAAHILHYCSIAILGVFVIQVDTHTHTRTHTHTHTHTHL